MGISDAEMIARAINEEIGDEFMTAEDVLQMDPLTKIDEDGYTVLGGQYGDMSILVWIQDDNGDIVIREVETVAW